MSKELTAERERLTARLAEIDAQLARPVLPEGWVDASEPPRICKTVRFCYETRGRKLVAPAYFNHGLGKWCLDESSTHVGQVKICGKPLYWQEAPADWLAPESREARYPRYFTPCKRCCGDTAYIRIDGTDGGHHFDWSGNQRDVHAYESEAEQKVVDGDWREITAAEAEAMVGPTVKESLTAEPTTAYLLDALHDAHCCNAELSENEYAAIRARILAADHSVDLRGVWEAIRENHKLGNHWPVKFRRSDGSEYCAIAYWDRDIMRWVTADTDLVSDDDAIAVLDPAALLPKIGGGE